MGEILSGFDCLPLAKRQAALRQASMEQDDWDAETNWPEIETITRHNAERRWLDEQAETEELVDDLGLIEVSAWEGVPIPERQWVIPDWVPLHAVTLIAGDGGTGKSLAVQQMLSSIATGAAFMGLRPSGSFPALYLNCEDGDDELHRRQDAIARAMGRSLAGFGSFMRISPRIGKENALGTIDERGRFIPSELYLTIRDAARRLGIRVIALDNAMQLYVGNPNDNGAVTRFLNALTALALDIDGAVILVAHTAKTDGSEFAHCMAWENGVRSRLYLTRESDEDHTSDVRILSRNKSNMSAIGARIEMEWRAGAFHPLDRDDDNGADREAERAFLACLDAATEARRNVSDKPSPAFAPKLFAKMPQGKRVGQKALERAMQRLFDKGLIVANVLLWRNEKQRRDAFGIARATGAKTAQTTAQTRAQTGAQTASNHTAQTGAHTHLNTTYYGAGPDGPPPPTEDDVAAWRDIDAAIAEELGLEGEA